LADANAAVRASYLKGHFTFSAPTSRRVLEQSLEGGKTLNAELNQLGLPGAKRDGRTTATSLAVKRKLGAVGEG
jgi:hypothetical protein